VGSCDAEYISRHTDRPLTSPTSHPTPYISQLPAVAFPSYVELFNSLDYSKKADSKLKTGFLSGGILFLYSPCIINSKKVML
jgi:hypothetical protein